MKNKIMFIGDAWGEEEALQCKPFVGTAGRQFFAFLNEVGIDADDCYFTTVMHFQPRPTNDIVNLCGPKAESIPGLPAYEPGKYLAKKYLPELDRLAEEIKTVDPNVIVALGDLPCLVLLEESRVVRLRGKIAIGLTGHKVLPTYAPHSVYRNWSLRANLMLDLIKAEKESHTKIYTRPSRKITYHPTLEEIENFYNAHLVPASRISIDIETARGQITYISFSPSAELSLVIAFLDVGNYKRFWPDKKQEIAAWDWVRKILDLPAEKIGQNFTYDMTYIWQIMGIPIRNFTRDTMVMQHSMFAEELKSLEYLASIHTDEASWKYMRGKGSARNKQEG